MLIAVVSGEEVARGWVPLYDDGATSLVCGKPWYPDLTDVDIRSVIAICWRLETGEDDNDGLDVSRRRGARLPAVSRTVAGTYTPGKRRSINHRFTRQDLLALITAEVVAGRAIPVRSGKP
jgi:hypothetical protein